ncbi:MAG: biotin transporter BioY [Proteobacteria bacterium]|nr:MAG: biotin transporter BioY [Pseudomonadota bacterium]
MQSQALIPSLLDSRPASRLTEATLVLVGSLALALLAQITIPLYFTPVPITGQTFGVAVMALLWGRKRALAVFALYIAEGAAGLPVFAQGASGLFMGPTLGYLVGMAASCFVVGSLSDRGYAKRFSTALTACAAGSVCVFTFGLIGLSFFMPKELLVEAGFLPFIPGDIIKSLLAAAVVTQGTRGFVK